MAARTSPALARIARTRFARSSTAPECAGGGLGFEPVNRRAPVDHSDANPAVTRTEPALHRPRRSALPAATLAVAVAAASCSGAVFADPSRRFQPDLLPREREVGAALAAGPKAIAAGAGVYALEADGYVLVRESENGFHCIVERSFPGAFEPQCLDEEGSRTLLPGILLEGELRMRGASDAEIAAAVAAAWAEGRLRAPARPGINYMLSKENRVPADATGSRIVPYRPHVMFYVPYATNRDLGAEPMGDSPVFVVGEGTPAAYAIVPVPEETVAPHEHR
jgi:hypothetical protein